MFRSAISGKHYLDSKRSEIATIQEYVLIVRTEPCLSVCMSVCMSVCRICPNCADRPMSVCMWDHRYVSVRVCVYCCVCVCVYVCMCMCMHVWISYEYIRVYIYIYIHTYYIGNYIFVRIYARVFTCCLKHLKHFAEIHNKNWFHPTTFPRTLLKSIYIYIYIYIYVYILVPTDHFPANFSLSPQMRNDIHLCTCSDWSRLLNDLITEEYYKILVTCEWRVAQKKFSKQHIIHTCIHTYIQIKRKYIRWIE